MRIITALLALAFFGWAAAQGTQVETAGVSYNSGTEMVSGFLARPSGKGPFPAIVVIHEWWGLNEQLKGEARRLAERGYVALAVDLYRGKVTASSDEAHELMRGLPEDRAVRDLRAAYSYLASRNDVRKDRIGSIGWCMGGGYSLQLAIAEPKLASSVIYYGRLVTEPATIRKIQAPLLGLFGEEDRGIPVSSVRDFEKVARDTGKAIQIHVYPGAGHAFANKEQPSYREEAARDAWEKTLAFLKKNLG